MLCWPSCHSKNCSNSALRSGSLIAGVRFPVRVSPAFLCSVRPPLLFAFAGLTWGLRGALAESLCGVLAGSAALAEAPFKLPNKDESFEESVGSGLGCVWGGVALVGALPRNQHLRPFARS